MKGDHEVIVEVKDTDAIAPPNSQTARSAPDGAAALRAISAEPPDLILLDIDMPGLSGIEALPAIRALAPDAKVIMVSGHTGVETSKRAGPRSL